MLINREDIELIKGVFEQYREQICSEFNIDKEFIEKFALEGY